MSGLDENKKYDNAIAHIKEKWEHNETIFTLAKQMEVLGKNMKSLRGAKDPDDRKKLRIVWQRAIQQYWDLVWAIIEAKIDAGPPEELIFDTGERLFIDFGHLYSEYTTSNDVFFEQLDEVANADIYQYNRLTDYIRESYALIFGKPYTGTSSGISMEEKQKRFDQELQQTQKRRRMVMTTLFSQFELSSKEDLETMLKSLEEGLRDAVETDMRTRRVREAEESERKVIRDHCRRYENAERSLWFQMDQLEKKLTQQDKEEKEAEAAAEAAEAAGETLPEPDIKDTFDPFAEIDAAPKPKKRPVRQTLAAAAALDDMEPEGTPPASAAERAEGLEDSEETAESINEKAAREAAREEIDQSLKIIQNVLSLHDRTKFLASMIVHVSNEATKWKRRVELAAAKYKGQGLPALKMELHEGLNNKKDFMMLCARQARVDVSPLCQNKNRPMSMLEAGKIMMDLTPLDPDMLRATRIRSYGIPRVILVPGQGLGVYDWSDNSLIIPIFSVVSNEKDISYSLAAFRWDNDEDRTLKDTFALLKQNKGKGIRGLQDQFSNDYYLWITFERKGYRKLKKDVSKWFKAFLKQKSGTGGGM